MKPDIHTAPDYWSFWRPHLRRLRPQNAAKKRQKDLQPYKNFCAVVLLVKLFRRLRRLPRRIGLA
jgi:hypothetical protein